MAKKVITQTRIIDDLTGEEVPEDEAVSLTFSYGGSDYEIDLSKRNAQALDDFMAKYIDAARKVRKGGGTGRNLLGGPATGRKFDRAKVAEWAKQNGYEVAERGRIKQDILDAYVAAGN